MIYTVFAAALAFTATNIDDMFVNMLLFATSSGKNQDRAIVTGKFLGTALLLAVSWLGAFGVQLLAGDFLQLLGFVPVALGIKEIIAYKKAGNADVYEYSVHSTAGVTLITLAGGADNIGVYLPLLGSFSRWQTAATAAVFFAMTGLWCVLGKKLADMPALQAFFKKYRPVLVPAVYILIGLYIIFM